MTTMGTLGWCIILGFYLAIAWASFSKMLEAMEDSPSEASKRFKSDWVLKTIIYPIAFVMALLWPVLVAVGLVMIARGVKPEDLAPKK